jgi:poly-gamma-glutamate capsule biosynthesis protein CapA/YwtB (metallophosphatase superfamily)
MEYLNRNNRAAVFLFEKSGNFSSLSTGLKNTRKCGKLLVHRFTGSLNFEAERKMEVFDPLNLIRVMPA